MGTQDSLPLHRPTGRRLSAQKVSTSSGEVLYRTETFTRDYKHQVAQGKVQGATTWNKFGYRTALTADGGEQPIWAVDSATPISFINTPQTVTIRYNPSEDGATAVGARVLTVWHVDGVLNANTITQHTLGSDGEDESAFTTYGINRMAVTQVGSRGVASGNRAEITVRASSLGTIQATLPASGSVTQQLMFHTGSGETLLIDSKWFNAIKPGGNLPIVAIKGYAYSRGLGITYEVFRGQIDTDTELTLSRENDDALVIGQNQTMWFAADTDTNDTNINGRFSGILYNDEEP